MMKKILSALLVASLPTIVSAQSTLQSVSNIFQANCTVGCHSGGSPSANLDLSGNPAALITALVGVTPINPAAAAKGRKLVDPGYPHNSFLLYKCGYNAWDNQFEREIAEGGVMPVNQPLLEKEEVELMRQWILYGAKQSGTQVSPQKLFDYYNVNGMARIEKPTAPAPSEGFQMHMGPFFLNPGEEIEFYKKEVVGNADVENITKFEAIFNDESHHFLLFEFEPGTSQSEAEGLRPVTVQNAFQNPYMVGWVDPDITELPYGTAYKINENAVIDLNYHIINYASNGDSVLAAEAYINYYSDNTTPDLIEMESELAINVQIFIPNNGQEVSFTNVYRDASSQDSLYIWFLSSHTHKYGTDYDIYKRNSDGSQGEQLYEGYYNTTYDFNQGYYDWEHPGNLYLDQVYGELIPIAEKDGIIQVAKFQIPGSANETAPFINFGLTTDDEMMLSFLQYTRQRVPSAPVEPNGISESSKASSFMSIYPNPTNGASFIKFSLKESANVQLTVFNSLGQEVNQVYAGSMAAGQASFEFDASAGSDPNGLYLIQLIVDGKVYSDRLLHLNR